MDNNFFRKFAEIVKEAEEGGNASSRHIQMTIPLPADMDESAQEMLFNTIQEAVSNILDRAVPDQDIEVSAYIMDGDRPVY